MREVERKSRRESGGPTQSSTRTRKTTVRPLKKVSTSLQIPNFQSLSALSLFFNYFYISPFLHFIFYIYREVIDVAVPPDLPELGQAAIAAIVTLPTETGTAAAAVMMHEGPFLGR